MEISHLPALLLSSFIFSRFLLQPIGLIGPHLCFRANKFTLDKWLLRPLARDELNCKFPPEQSRMIGNSFRDRHWQRGESAGLCWLSGVNVFCLSQHQVSDLIWAADRWDQWKTETERWNGLSFCDCYDLKGLDLKKNVIIISSIHYTYTGRRCICDIDWLHLYHYLWLCCAPGSLNNRMIHDVARVWLFPVTPWTATAKFVWPQVTLAVGLTDKPITS